MATKKEITPETQTGALEKIEEQTAISLAFEQEMLSMLTDVGSDDRDLDATFITLPNLIIVQKLSAVNKKTSSRYIPGLKEGQFVNSINKDVFENVEFVPCAFKETVVEWKPDQGGKAGEHTKESPEYKKVLAAGYTDLKTGAPTCAETGNSFIETIELYGLVVNDGKLDPVIMYFKGSFIRCLKELNTLAQQAKINGKPCRYYSYVYNLESKITSSDKGEWATMEFSYNNPVNKYAPNRYPEIVKAAMEFRDMIYSDTSKFKKDDINADGHISEDSEEVQNII
jgi:hypothetical protein